jgi:hypothetical protein
MGGDHHLLSGSVRVRNKPLLDLAISFGQRLELRLDERKRGPVRRDKLKHLHSP